MSKWVSCSCSDSTFHPGCFACSSRNRSRGVFGFFQNVKTPDIKGLTWMNSANSS